jgi:type II secretory pathway predicted ATPase ExeA
LYTHLLTLASQPDQAHKLRFGPHEVLHQHITVLCKFPSFDPEETAGYIKHHLCVAGFQGSLFSDTFISGVYHHTKGVARRINNLCRSALLLGASEGRPILDEADHEPVTLNPEGPNS